MDIDDFISWAFDLWPDKNELRKRRRKNKTYFAVDRLREPKTFLRSLTLCKFGRHVPMQKMSCEICKHCRTVLYDR